MSTNRAAVERAAYDGHGDGRNRDDQADQPDGQRAAGEDEYLQGHGIAGHLAADAG
ncbi:MAG TPA: hypothetical protein VNF47_28020 [Streptosporangiaceae bacterium]|nr:hypothetical protein [Streptosporangiaceae bacterium]